MDSFSLRFPHTIIFGAGKITQLPSLLPRNVARVLLVCGTHSVADGQEGRLRSILEQDGIQVTVHSGVPSEPPPAAVDAIVKDARNASADAIVALGGGSVMDAAKAAAALVRMDGCCDDFFSGRAEIDPGARIPLACLPTTAGTGAESTSNAVLTDPVTSVKKSLRHPSMMPEIALVDPEFTLSCPVRVTAASGLDALVQAIESYISPRASSVTRALAKTAFLNICKSIVRCCEQPDDIAARSLMAEGSMLAGMAFANSGLGAIHGIAHPLGSLLHVPHGVACSVLMIPVFRFNESACAHLYEELFAEIVPAGGSDCSADCFLDYLASLCQSLNIPDNFRSYGISSEHYPFIVANCRSGSMKNNPVYMSDDDVRAVLTAVS